MTTFHFVRQVSTETSVIFSELMYIVLNLKLFLILTLSHVITSIITYREKLLSADWLRQRAFFLNQEGSFGNQEGMVT